VLTAADKRWIRTMLKDEIAKLLEDMIAGQQSSAVGGYDGATIVEDDNAEARRKRVGFETKR
jgi:hypothetical protein